MRRLNSVGLCIILLIGCEIETEFPVLDDTRSFDIVLIAGQSDTDSGAGLDYSIDTACPNIFQLRRFGSNNMVIIDPAEPLDHHDKQVGKIGFGLTFANQYVSKRLIKADRSLLIIPCGRGSNGFFESRLNRGDDHYRDAMNHVYYALGGNIESKVVAIIWHQGEQDVYWISDIEYQKAMEI